MGISATALVPKEPRHSVEPGRTTAALSGARIATADDDGDDQQSALN